MRKPPSFEIDYTLYKERLRDACWRGFIAGMNMGALLGLIVGGFACWMAHG